MTARRTLTVALLGLLALGAAPASASGPAEVSTERVCVGFGSDPADRHGVCVNVPWPGQTGDLVERR